MNGKSIAAFKQYLPIDDDDVRIRTRRNDSGEKQWSRARAWIEKSPAEQTNKGTTTISRITTTNNKTSTLERQTFTIVCTKYEVVTFRGKAHSTGPLNH